MKLAINIQATHKRDFWIKTLLFMLNDKRAKPCFDTTDSLWGGAKQTLQSYTPSTTHLLVLQDDILPCKDLIPTVERLIEILPDEPITLFSNKNSILEARNLGLNWVALRKFLMAQAYIMPIPIIEDFLPWVEKHVKPEIYFDDNRWAMYFFYHKLLVRATVPSLVEHLGWGETTLRQVTPSYVFDFKNRMAKWFIGVENSGLDINWENTDSFLDDDGSNSDFCQYLIE